MLKKKHDLNKLIPLSPSRYDSVIFFKKYLPFYLKKTKNLLDVGCGKLFFLNLKNEIHYSGNYVGIDIEPVNFIINNRKIKLIQQSIFEIKSTLKFDTIVCLWVLEHIKDDKKALKTIHKNLKVDGLFIVAVPSIWTFPFEFGKHGYHYYSKSRIKTMLEKSGFKEIQTYDSGGLLGFMFMIVLNWPRFIILIPTFFIWKLLLILKINNSSWKNFSKKAISITIYYYLNFNKGIEIHNKIVKLVSIFDNFFKIFPSSYIFIAKKK